MTQVAHKFNTAYGKRTPVRFTCDPVSLTHQSEKNSCDINEIMKKFEKTGILEHRNSFEGQYGDFTGLPQDYHESMNAVIAAEEMFTTLPSRIRRRFANDPGNFLDFVANPDNAKELVKMGLAEAPLEDLIESPVPPEPKNKEAAPAVPKSPDKGDIPA